MRLPKTPEMQKIWDEIEPYLEATNEGYVILNGAPSDIAEKLEEYRRLGKEQSDFAWSLEQ